MKLLFILVLAGFVLWALLENMDSGNDPHEGGEGE